MKEGHPDSSLIVCYISLPSVMTLSVKDIFTSGESYTGHHWCKALRNKTVEGESSFSPSLLLFISLVGVSEFR